MDKHPTRSKLMRFEIVEDGDRIKIDVSNEGRPDSYVTFDYGLLGDAIAFMLRALGQSIGIRTQARKDLRSSIGKIPAQPVTVSQFQVHIAEDKTHALMEFEPHHGLSIQFAMTPQKAEDIARKIFTDLQLYPPPDRRH